MRRLIALVGALLLAFLLMAAKTAADKSQAVINLEKCVEPSRSAARWGCPEVVTRGNICIYRLRRKSHGPRPMAEKSPERSQGLSVLGQRGADSPCLWRRRSCDRNLRREIDN